MIVSTVDECDAYIASVESRARAQYPGFERYEFCCGTGELFLFSLGAYPTIIKNYADIVSFGD